MLHKKRNVNNDYFKLRKEQLTSPSNKNKGKSNYLGPNREKIKIEKLLCHVTNCMSK